jgi:hypothetical protein
VHDRVVHGQEGEAADDESDGEGNGVVFHALSSGRQEPHEQDGQRRQHGGEQERAGPSVFFVAFRARVHAFLPYSTGRAAGLTCRNTTGRFRPMKFTKKSIPNAVILFGGLINLVVIVLILFFYVF